MLQNQKHCHNQQNNDDTTKATTRTPPPTSTQLSGATKTTKLWCFSSVGGSQERNFGALACLQCWIVTMLPNVHKKEIGRVKFECCGCFVGPTATAIWSTTVASHVTIVILFSLYRLFLVATDRHQFWWRCYRTHQWWFQSQLDLSENLEARQ